jgi:hypothetical protein
MRDHFFRPLPSASHRRHSGPWFVELIMVSCWFIGGCTNIATPVSGATSWIGDPIAVIEEIAEREKAVRPGEIQWSIQHRYSLSDNLWVYPVSPAWGCSTEYVVNSAEIIVGFNLVGDGCTFSKWPGPW